MDEMMGSDWLFCVTAAIPGFSQSEAIILGQPFPRRFNTGYQIKLVVTHCALHVREDPRHAQLLRALHVLFLGICVQKLHLFFRTDTFLKIYGCATAQLTFQQNITKDVRVLVDIRVRVFYLLGFMLI
jgi:hypothetical protein